MEIRKMDYEERNTFLERPLVAVFAINEEGKGPHQTPVWFRYYPEEYLFRVMTKASSKKARLLDCSASLGQASLCIQESAGATAKYVNVTGDCTLVDLSEEVVQQFADVYLPPIYREMYVADPPEDSLFIIRPLKIVTGVIG